VLRPGLVFFTLWLPVLACCSPAPSSSSSKARDEQAVAAALNDYAAAVKTNDVARITAWWTEDAVVINRGAPTIHGRAAWASLLTQLFASTKITDASVHVDEISASGDLAYLIATYDEALQPERGPLRHDRGRFVFIWRRQPDGSWKIARGIGTDLPGS
jgi:uncharacterized protein (TIGR02246 family)